MTWNRRISSMVAIAHLVFAAIQDSRWPILLGFSTLPLLCIWFGDAGGLDVLEIHAIREGLGNANLLQPTGRIRRGAGPGVVPVSAVHDGEGRGRETGRLELKAA
jgi:hypothetical protein